MEGISGKPGKRRLRRGGEGGGFTGCVAQEGEGGRRANAEGGKAVACDASRGMIAVGDR